MCVLCADLQFGIIGRHEMNKTHEVYARSERNSLTCLFSFEESFFPWECFLCIRYTVTLGHCIRSWQGKPSQLISCYLASFGDEIKSLHQI
jgi:hypothetical protein